MGLCRFAAFFLCCAAIHSAVLPPPYFSANRRHVADNLNTLNDEGLLNPGLAGIVTTLSGLSTGDLNHALDRMHPAPYSDLVEVQAALGGQILSLFHREPRMSCGCDTDWRIWIDPIGSWLTVGNSGEQTGFEARTRGVAAGFDGSIGENWTFGGGVIWNHSNITFHRGYGSGTVNRYLGALFTDFIMECFYCGFSVYAGLDRNDISRLIEFPTFASTAHGEFNSIDAAGQFQAAYLFGTPYCYFYPYANFDFLYLRGQKFTEEGKSSLNLKVRSQSNGTVRGEAGIGLQFQDTNYTETICVSPKIAFGWAMVCPVFRPTYKSNFIGEPLKFNAKGWNHTWQLFTLDFGLALSIYNVVLSGEYIAEIAPAGRDNYWAQRANLSLEYNW